MTCVQSFGKRQPESHLSLTPNPIPRLTLLPPLLLFTLHFLFLRRKCMNAFLVQMPANRKANQEKRSRKIPPPEKERMTHRLKLMVMASGEAAHGHRLSGLRPRALKTLMN